MGSLKTFPGIVTAVVGRCEASLDQRDLDAGVLAAMYRQAREASERFAQEERCTVEWSGIWSIEPIAFHPSLISFCEAAVAETARTAQHMHLGHRMPSGPLHDAAEVSKAGIPTVMMFVQSLQGISHNKIEDTREEHLELAVRAFANLAARTADWILSGGAGLRPAI
jgi:N-carbamoyl-L-amino-acid hydrolase